MKHSNEKVVLYDDTCNVCTVAKDSIVKRDKGGTFRLVGTHSDEGKRLAREHNLDTESSAYIIEDGKARSKSDAALYVLENLGWFEKLVARIGRLLPNKAADAIYGFVNKNRKFFNR